MVSTGQDPDAVAEQYDDPANLNARVRLHVEYSTNDTGLHEWVFDRLDVPPDGRILEVGAGPGLLWRHNRERIPWSVVVTDASAGMVTEAREHLGGSAGFAFGTADAARLPFPAETFDAVVANHMLYHVPDRRAAFGEFARVLLADGAVYATTNGPGHMAELRELVERAVGEDFDRASEAFSLSNGRRQLEAVFEDVALHRYPDSLRVTDVEPAVAYATSFNDVMADHAELIERLVGERMADGPLAVTKETGMFVAKP